MNQKLKETLKLASEIPGDAVRLLWNRALYAYLGDLVKVLACLAIAWALLGQVTMLGHGDEEYQKQHEQRL